MWIKVNANIPKEGAMNETLVDGNDILIARSEGKLYCALNRCPHEDIKLTLGCIKDNRITCSLHGYSFSLNSGQSSDSDVENLQMFGVKQEGNDIYIEVQQ